MNDTIAIRRVIDGDPSAFEHVVRRYQRPIYNLMFRAAGDRDAAAELTQEAFFRAFRGLDGFDPARRFFPWLYSLGMNLARDHLRRKKAEPVMLDEEEADSRVEQVSEQEIALIRKADARAVALALDALGIDQREALVLRFKEDFTMQEIADALGISLSGAKMRVSRGLNSVRQILSENGHGPEK
jgi:RNA polymerase sigma-70 factor (ECF subfamily)